MGLAGERRAPAGDEESVSVAVASIGERGRSVLRRRGEPSNEEDKRKLL